MTNNSMPIKGDILIVDDTPANLDVLSTMLMQEGYDVRAAINGEMALMAIAADPPDLILLDINMPGMDGYQVCERIKASSQVCDITNKTSQRTISDIPIIFVSASDEIFDKVKAFRLGAVDYVAKPFQIEEILARINHQLTIHWQQHELQERYMQIQALQGVVQQYLSASAWENIVASSANKHYPHRRETLTIFMSDIAGFTTLSEQLDPDLLLADLSMYLNMVTTAIYTHEGQVDKFLGDGILAFFHSPHQAVQASYAIQRHIVAFNANQQKSHRAPFPTRIGITTGNVLLARIGSHERKEYTLIGDRVNVSARLQAEAPLNGILMDEATYHAIESPTYVVPNAISLKGKGERERVYTVFYDAIDTM